MARRDTDDKSKERAAARRGKNPGARGKSRPEST